MSHVSQDRIVIQRALFSVSDKSGLVPFATGMLKINPVLQIISTGGTAKTLAESKLPFVPLSEKTKFPECFSGRVKTLHPAILGGVLYRRGIDEKEASSLEIEPIDLIVCNLYPFEKASQDPAMEMSQLVESMDIGGSSLIRSGCKNFFSVAVVVDPADYPSILEELATNQGTLSLKTRENLAVKAMQLSATYEARIASEFAKRLQKETSQSLHLQLEGGRKLRYGENPDQEGWVYSFQEQKGIAASKVLMGKELSYNNYEDASQGFFAVQRLYPQQEGSIAAIVKHGGLCGFATGSTVRDAFERAWDGDTKSAFGSIVALTQTVDDDFRDALKERFIEMLLAPSFTPSFVEWALVARPSLRLLQVSFEECTPMLYRSISGGLLVQTPKKDLYSSLEQFLVPIAEQQAVGVATKRMPNPEHMGLFRFAIAAVQSVKSNAIVIAREYAPGFYQLIGVGGGQPNRVDSMQKLACPKAIENLQKMVGEKKVAEALGQAVLISDGFFPFADAIAIAAEYGIKTCLQPGGSIRDKDVIHAADEHDLCMIFTGQRYFNH